MGLAVGIPLALILFGVIGYLVYHFKYKKKGAQEQTPKQNQPKKPAQDKETERIKNQFSTNDVQFATNPNNPVGANIEYMDQAYKPKNQMAKKMGMGDSKILKTAPK